MPSDQSKPRVIRAWPLPSPPEPVASGPTSGWDRLPLQCPECGYDTTGLNRCPECGLAMDVLVLKGNWREWRINPTSAKSLIPDLMRFRAATMWYAIWPILVLAVFSIMAIFAELAGLSHSRFLVVIGIAGYSIAGAVWCKLFVFNRLRLLLHAIPHGLAKATQADPPLKPARIRLWTATCAAALIWVWPLISGNSGLIDWVVIPMVLSYTAEAISAFRFPISATLNGRKVLERNAANLALIGVPLAWGLLTWELWNLQPPAEQAAPAEGPFSDSNTATFFGWLILICSLSGGAKTLERALSKPVSQLPSDEKAAAPQQDGRSQTANSNSV